MSGTGGRRLETGDCDRRAAARRASEGLSGGQRRNDLGPRETRGVVGGQKRRRSGPRQADVDRGAQRRRRPRHHGHDSIRQEDRLVEVVRDHHRRHRLLARIAQGGQVRLQGLAGQRVQRPERLVQEEHPAARWQKPAPAPRAAACRRSAGAACGRARRQAPRARAPRSHAADVRAASRRGRRPRPPAARSRARSATAAASSSGRRTPRPPARPVTGWFGHRDRSRVGRVPAPP